MYNVYVCTRVCVYIIGSSMSWEYGGNFAGSGKQFHSSASQTARQIIDKTERPFPRNSSTIPTCSEFLRSYF